MGEFGGLALDGVAQFFYFAVVGAGVHAAVYQAKAQVHQVGIGGIGFAVVADVV